MIRKITLLLSLLIAIPTLFSTNNITILNDTYQMDTLFHAKVGPGTTQTSLKLWGPRNLRVFYLTIDLTDPTVKIRVGNSNDKLAGGETTANYAKRKSSAGNLYFGGVNGDFFATSGAASNGNSIVGTPTSATIQDGEIFKTSTGNKQFAVDFKGVPFIGLADFSQGTISKGTDHVPFKAINVNSPSDAVTLYTPRYYGVTNQTNRANACAEVTAKLVEGESFVTGKTWKMQITSNPTATGNLAIPSDGFVIHGRGTSTSVGTMSALDFVNGLKVGDIITIDSKVSIDGTQVAPDQLISGNPRIAGDGQTLDTESERGDASAYHPRTGIGYGANKTKVIMMVVDGRSSLSDGVRTSQLADLMRYAGATDAINLDGGGSSTLYTSALGVRNNPSDGNDRADGNHIYAVTSAPEDNEIAEIRFVDWTMKFPKYGVYTPKFYGYNKYGVMVNTDVQGVTLSCPKELGEIQNLNTFVGSGEGTYALTAKLGNITASIPVTIVVPQEVKVRVNPLITDSYKNYTEEVLGVMAEASMPIAASSLTWSSADPSIVSIDAKTGVLRGLKNGETTISGVVGTTSVTQTVKVQVPTNKYMPIESGLDPTSWKITQTGGTGIAGTVSDNGMKLTYTGNGSSRGANIKLTKEVNVWSLPDAFHLRINPGDAVMKNVLICLLPNNSASVNYTQTLSLVPNEYNDVEIPLNNFFDTADMQYYPVKLAYMTFNMGVSTSGTAYTIDIPNIECKYNEAASVGGILADNKGSLITYPNPVNAGENINIVTGSDNEATTYIYNSLGQEVVSQTVIPQNGTIQIPTSKMASGIYFVKINQNNEHKSATLIVK